MQPGLVRLEDGPNFGDVNGVCHCKAKREDAKCSLQQCILPAIPEPAVELLRPASSMRSGMASGLCWSASLPMVYKEHSGRVLRTHLAV